MKRNIIIAIASILMLLGLEAATFPMPLNASSIDTSYTLSDINTIHGTNTNWAGYVVVTNLNSPQKNAITDVKGSWIVPSVSGPVSTNTYSANWIGIDGYSSHTVEQIGTDANVINGIAEYAAWYEMFPKPPVYLNMTISSGDTISAEVNYMGMGFFRLSITDVTTGESFSTVQKSSDKVTVVSSDSRISNNGEHIVVDNALPLTIDERSKRTSGFEISHNKLYSTIEPMTVSVDETGLLGIPHRSSAEWIVEAPSDSSGVLPLADFGTTSFFNAQVTVNGVTGSINDPSWQHDALTMQTSTSPPIIKAQPSPLFTNGTSFNVTWLHQ